MRFFTTFKGKKEGFFVVMLNQLTHNKMYLLMNGLTMILSIVWIVIDFDSFCSVPTDILRACFWFLTTKQIGPNPRFSLKCTTVVSLFKRLIRL